MQNINDKNPGLLNPKPESLNFIKLPWNSAGLLELNFTLFEFTLEVILTVFIGVLFRKEESISNKIIAVCFALHV